MSLCTQSGVWSSQPRQCYVHPTVAEQTGPLGIIRIDMFACVPSHSQWLRKRGLVGNFLTPLVGMGSRP